MVSEVEIGSELEQYTYQYFLGEALKMVPDDIDSREGSIIYDALAPACFELAAAILKLKNVVLESYTATASGKYLDLKGLEVGIKRIEATKAIVKARFLKQGGTPYEISVGDRFSTIGDSPLFFRVTEYVEEGEYLLECETTGIRGNQYLGTLLPVSNYQDLMEATLVEITIPARDEETDDELRERILKARNTLAFGGNVADYLRFTSEIDGVGAVQVYPIWNGGGTVRVVFLNNSYGVPSAELVNKVQHALDPTEYSQLGRGIAPIGHKVTVAAPVEKRINVSFEVTLNNGYTIEQLKPTIEKQIESYFLSVRKSWDELQEDYSYSSWIFRSQIISTVLSVAGVANAQNIRLNGLDEDVQIQTDNVIQELPIFGEVDII